MCVCVCVGVACDGAPSQNEFHEYTEIWQIKLLQCFYCDFFPDLTWRRLFYVGHVLSLTSRMTVMTFSCCVPPSYAYMRKKYLSRELWWCGSFSDLPAANSFSNLSQQCLLIVLHVGLCRLHQELDLLLVEWTLKGGEFLHLRSVLLCICRK